MADIADIVIRVDSTQVSAATGNLKNLQRNTVGLLSSLSRAGAASLQYKREVALLNEANRQNILTHNELARSLRQLESRYNSMGLAVDSAGNLIESSQGQANNFGHKVQQVGYQVGDFFVQVQSGTNFMVAFGQQATQLAGLIPGVLGAALGIGISLFTAIGATLMRSSESAGTFQDALDKVKDSLSETDDILGFVNGDLEELKKNFGDLSSATQSLVDTKLDIALRGMADAAKSLRGELTEMYSGSVWGNTSRAQELGQVFRFGTKNTRELAAAMEDLKSQDTLQGQVEAGARLRELFLSMAGPVEEMTSEERDFYIAMVDAEEASRRLLEATERVKEATEGTAEAQKVNVEYAERYYQIQQEQDALNKERDAAVQSLIDKRDEELNKLAQERDMLQAINAYGKDSVEVRELEAKFAREAYQSELERKGLVGNFLTLLMEEYDLTAAVKKEMEDMSPLQREINEYAQQFAQTDLASGVDAAAAAALELAKRLNISLDRAKGMMALGYGAPVIFDPRDPDYDPEAAARERARQLQEDRFGFNYGNTVTGTKFADDKKGGGGKGDPLEELRQQIALENELLGVSEAQARVIQALGQDRSKYSEAEINAITAEIEAYNQKQEAIARTKQIMDTVKSSMEDAFMSMVDGTKSAKDAFRDMAAMIIKELYRVLVVQQLVNSIAGAIGPIFGGSSAPTSSPRPMPRPSGVAVGGSIMAGGSYLVGENGPELVIPRHSGTVVNANQTAAMGGNSGAVTVNNNITVTGSDAAMVRVEIAKMIPQITNATKAAVIDAKQRGGQMAAAFR